MSDATALHARVQEAGNLQSVPAMQNISVADANDVFAYFRQLRDGEIAVGASPAFTSTVVGQTTSTTFSVTVRNYRRSSVSYSFSTTGADYSIVSALGGTCGAATTTAPTSCAVTVEVAFSPTGSGTRLGSLNLVLAPAIGTPSVPAVQLTATGIAAVPGFSITPASRTFSTKVGTSQDQSFTISNPGTVATSLSSFAFSSSRYSRAASSTCSAPSSLAAGASCTLTVTFAPLAPAGTTNASLTINHSAAGIPATAALNGTGTLATVSPSSSLLSFGSSQIGVPKVLPAITVTNSGTASLVISTDPTSAAARGGAHPNDFSIASTCSTASPLSVGASCTITGTFTPTALGVRNATLTVASDATNTPLEISLDGTGVALPEPVVTYPASAFPDTVIGETAAQTRQIAISNSRTRNITYSLTAPTDFPIAAESCVGRVVPGGGGSCTITLQFRPTLGSGEGQRTPNVPITFTGTAPDAAPGSSSGSVTGKALLPLLLSATSLSPAAVVGTPSTVSALLTNRAGSALALSDLVFSGANATDHSLDASNGCARSATLASGATCTLVIRFDPAAAGPRAATLTVTHTASGSPQAITLNGNATPRPQGDIALSLPAITYADTQLGSSTARSVTVRNVGNLALNFSAFTLAGTHPAEFSRSGDCSTATPLAINASCTLTVTFAPAALGLRSASLTIVSDASSGAATLTLSGQGVPVPAPLVTLTPATLDFGDQTLGGIYPTRSVRLSNAGTADLTGIAVALQGAAFATATACPPLLMPGKSCDVAIGFGPIAANTDYGGTLSVTSNAVGSPHSVTLRGRGTARTVPVLLWQPAVAQLDFGTVAAGTVSAPQSATLVNQGPGGVVFTLLNSVGVDAAAFAVTGGTCTIGQTLFEGESCSVSISFAPAAAGTRTALLQVASSGSAPQTLSLTGVGLGGPVPMLALSVVTLAFDATRVGAQSLPAEVLLSSAGSGALRVTALEVSGAYAVQSKTCPALPFLLPVGSSCSVSVTFQPQAEGSAAGAMRVTSDALPALSEVALSGNGQAKADVIEGGCSIADGDSLLDPTLWALVLAAFAVLGARARGRRIGRRR